MGLGHGDTSVNTLILGKAVLSICFTSRENRVLCSLTHRYRTATKHRIGDKILFGHYIPCTFFASTEHSIWFFLHARPNRDASPQQLGFIGPVLRPQIEVVMNRAPDGTNASDLDLNSVCLLIRFRRQKSQPQQYTCIIQRAQIRDTSQSISSSANVTN